MELQLARLLRFDTTFDGACREPEQRPVAWRLDLDSIRLLDSAGDRDVRTQSSGCYCIRRVPLPYHSGRAAIRAYYSETVA